MLKILGYIAIFLILTQAVILQAAVNETQINIFRKDFMKHILSNTPFSLTAAAFKLQLQNNNEKPAEDPDEVVKFYFYNRQFPRESIQINHNLSLVNPRLPVKLLVHGWTEHYYVIWCKNLTAAYLKNRNYNIIIPDWSKKGDADYVSASLAVKEVSNIIGDWIVDKLAKRMKGFNKIHLISHSLGCHVAGLTGQRVFERSGSKVARITALDAAAPIFDLYPLTKDDRLSADDADFVDILHTDAGVLGFRESIGTADFYPNGGKAIQPGCSLLRPDVSYDDLFCSHARSHKYFLKSVLTNDIQATPCESWEKYVRGNCDSNQPIKFGDKVSTKISGTFFFKTPDEEIITETLDI